MLALITQGRVPFDRAALEPAYLASPLRRLSWAYATHTHFAIPKAQLAAVLAAAPAPGPWVKGENECAQAAEMLRYWCMRELGWRGMGYVVDYGGRHCYNVALCVENGAPSFLLVEPRTLEVVPPFTPVRGREHERYDLRRGIVVL